MQPDDRAEFERHLAVLFAALDKPCTETKQEAFWKGCTSMTLVEFARCCEHMLSELKDGEPRRTLSVPDLWAAKKRLRAASPVVQLEPKKDNWKGDPWDIHANTRFMKYITTRLAANSRRWGDPNSREQKAATEVLLAYKHAWARDMREWDFDRVTGEVLLPSASDQQSAWDECMARAEGEIAMLSAKAAA